MQQDDILKLGAHVSISGGYSMALERIVKIQGNCLQIFSSSPRSWVMPQVAEEEKGEFLKKKEELGIDPIYFHATYLVNLADSGHIAELSKKSLIKDLEIASQISIKGVVVHTGSFKNGSKDTPYSYNQVPESVYRILLKNIQEVLEKSPQNSLLILENSGTRKIGWDIKELGYIIKKINNPRLKVCLDTCHLHAAGYDLTTSKKLDTFLDFFDKEIGLSNLELFHVNDSKDLLGSFRDRHENIGKGNVGEEAFYQLLHSQKTRNLPYILEVPGADKKGPDLENVLALKRIAKND